MFNTLIIKLNLFILRGVLSCIVLILAAAIDAQAGYLYVLNDATTGNNIYGYSVNESTGALTALAGFPVPAGGNGNGDSYSFPSETLTIDRLNNRLYVVNSGSNTVSAYSINAANGALTALFSPIVLPAGQLWQTIAVHPSGSPLIVSGDDAAHTTGVSASYNVTATTTTAAAGSPFSTGAAVPYSSVFSRDGNYFYTGGNTGGSFFAGFGVDAGTGVLTSLGAPFDSGSPFPDSYATDAQGRLFIVSSSNGEGRVFTTVSGIPTAVSGNPFPSGLSNVADGKLHPNGNIYVFTDAGTAPTFAGRIGSFLIANSGSNTTLTQVAGSPYSSGGASSLALAFNQTGNFLYVANGISRNITTYSVDITTGVLTNNNIQPINTLGTSGRLYGMDYLPAVITAASVPVGGRVVAGKGIGVSSARVYLTDGSGETRTALTNPFGYYRFEEVPVGETYIFSVRHKRYQFNPQIFNVVEETNDLDFVALP